MPASGEPQATRMKIRLGNVTQFIRKATCLAGLA
jgi:hypothetical protein